MPLYLPRGTDGESYLGPAIHAEGIEQADVEAFRLYGKELGHVEKAPKIVKPWRGPRKARPPSMYAEAKMLTAYGVFEQPEWVSAGKSLDITPMDRIMALHQRFVRRREKLAALGR